MTVRIENSSSDIYPHSCTHNSIIFDDKTSEEICSQCGLVIEERIIDFANGSAQFFTQEERDKRAQHGPLIPDYLFGPLLVPDASVHDHSYCQKSLSVDSSLKPYDSLALKNPTNDPAIKVLDLKDEGSFITFGEFKTFYAICPNLMGQSCLVHLPEPKFLKELYLISENEDAAQVQSARLRNARFHQFPTNALATIGSSYHK